MTRPLELQEYKNIVYLALNGFITKDNKVFRPNIQLALTFQLQANLGLRISDVLKLKINNFKNGKLELMEKKTNKLQYRSINHYVYDYVKDYAINNKLGQDDFLIKVSVRAIQKQLKIITDYLGLSNVSTHSFRKMFATTVYQDNNNNIELVRELLNHTSIATTQRYIRLSQNIINAASESINFLV